jgi:CO dehydrogenase/acetyl-CoA synthase beta subunit
MNDVKTAVHIDTEGNFYETRTQDVGDILDSNKADYNSANEHGRWKGDMHLVSRIPLTVALEWEKEGVGLLSGKVDEKKLRQKLNSNEYRYLRTIPGRV